MTPFCKLIYGTPLVYTARDCVNYNAIMCRGVSLGDRVGVLHDFATLIFCQSTIRDSIPRVRVVGPSLLK